MMTLHYNTHSISLAAIFPHHTVPLRADIASLEVHFRIITTISPTDISLKRHSCPCVNIQWTSVEIHLGFHLMTMLESQMRNTSNNSWPEYVSTGSCVLQSCVLQSHFKGVFFKITMQSLSRPLCMF